MKMRRYRGFTLLELMVTVSVASILLSVGVPSFRGAIMDSRFVRDSNQFVGSINLARSAAVRFQRTATICASANFSASVPTCSASTDWSQGWIVWVDKDRDGATDADEILSVQAPINTSNTFTAATATLFSYDARGFGLSPADNLALCDSRSGETGRSIRVNNVGRTNVSRQDCS
jgi:type IV fimbrial biogenesis protein FimT